jgi:hypothetical protein
MKRREFLPTVAAGLALRPFSAFAQTSARRPLIACLVGGSKAATERRLRRGAALGPHLTGMSVTEQSRGSRTGRVFRGSGQRLHLIKIASTSAVADAKGPEPVNDERLTVGIAHLAEKLAGPRIEGVDMTVSEIAD